MNEDTISNTATSTHAVFPSFMDKIFSAYVDLSTLPFIAIPLAYLVWSFQKAVSYHKENGSFHTNIADSLDKQAFQKIIVPLYSFISKGLREEIAEEVSSTEQTEKIGIVEEADEKRLALLQQRDFSYLEQSIELQDTIQGIIKSKKNQLTLKSCIKWSRIILIVLTIINFVTVALGVALVYAKKVMQSDPASSVLFFIWCFFFGISVMLGILFFNHSLKIEGMSHE